MRTCRSMIGVVGMMLILGAAACKKDSAPATATTDPAKTSTPTPTATESPTSTSSSTPTRTSTPICTVQPSVTPTPEVGSHSYCSTPMEVGTLTGQMILTGSLMSTPWQDAYRFTTSAGGVHSFIVDCYGDNTSSMTLFLYDDTDCNNAIHIFGVGAPVLSTTYSLSASTAYRAIVASGSIDRPSYRFTITGP